MENERKQKNVKGNSANSDLFRCNSIRAQVFHELDKNPLLTAKPLCTILGYDFKTHGHYVKNLRSEWKGNCRNGLGSNAPTSQHNVRAFCYAPKDLRKDLIVGLGWTLSRNRNKTLAWNKDRATFGRVELFTSGKIIVYVRKPHTLTRARQLLTKAFFDTYLITDPKVMGAMLDSVRWKGAHDVYQTDQRLPYKVITTYVGSHELRIVTGDASDPYAIEVQWAHPDWLERLELMQQQNIRTIESLNSTLKALGEPRAPEPVKNIGVI